jgi:magnesium-transporting ATPase (P-type)
MTQEQEKQKWHSMEADKVIETLSSDKDNGLSGNEVDELTEKYGLNDIPRGKKDSWFVSVINAIP